MRRVSIAEGVVRRMVADARAKALRDAEGYLRAWARRLGSKKAQAGLDEESHFAMDYAANEMRSAAHGISEL